MVKKSEIDVEQLCIDYLKDDASLTTLSKVYNCSKSLLSKLIRNSNNKDAVNKIKLKAKGKASYKKGDINPQKIIEEYLKPGASLRSVAKLFGNVNPNTIKRIIDESKHSGAITQKEVNKLQSQPNQESLKTMCILQCTNCGEYIKIKERFYQKNCKCGKNIIYCGTVNFLNCKVVYKSKKLKEWLLKGYDEYR